MSLFLVRFKKSFKSFPPHMDIGHFLPFLRLLNWEKGKERWTKVLASKSLRTLEGVEEEEEEVNEEAEEGDDDKKEERMLWSTA